MDSNEEGRRSRPSKGSSEENEIVRKMERDGDVRSSGDDNGYQGCGAWTPTRTRSGIQGSLKRMQ